MQNCKGWPESKATLFYHWVFTHRSWKLHTMKSNGFDFIDHFPTKSPSTPTVFNNKEQVYVHIPCPAYVARFWNPIPGSTVDAVTLSNQFCDGFPNLQTCVLYRSHAQATFLMDSSVAELIWNAFWVLSAPWFRRRGWKTPFSASQPQQSFLYSPRKQWPCHFELTENFWITLLFLFRKPPLFSLRDLHASLDCHSILIGFAEYFFCNMFLNLFFDSI